MLGNPIHLDAFLMHTCDLLLQLHSLSNIRPPSCEHQNHTVIKPSAADRSRGTLSTIRELTRLQWRRDLPSWIRILPQRLCPFRFIIGSSRSTVLTNRTGIDDIIKVVLRVPQRQRSHTHEIAPSLLFGADPLTLNRQSGLLGSQADLTAAIRDPISSSGFAC